jgi:hypothetical protein
MHYMYMIGLTVGEFSVEDYAVIKARDYRSLVNKVLQRVGFFDAIAEPPPDQDPRRAMPNGVASGQFNSERLAALRKLYEKFPCSARVHSHWTEVLASEIDLSLFRRDSSYMWQHRDGNVPLTYIATYYYHLLSGDRDLLEMCIEDNSFGVYNIEINGDIVSRDRLDSVAELGFLRRVLQLKRHSQVRILDIGSGYGRLGWRISQCFPKIEVLCADAVAESSFLCEGYLHYRSVPRHVRMVTLPDVESELSRQSVDLAMAINSLSECSAEAITWWLDLLTKNQVPRIMIAPHAAYNQGLQIFSHEMSGQAAIPVEPLLEERGYRRHTIEPKYTDKQMQLYGVSPTHFHLFTRKDISNL